ncbi:hypothetical protein GCM10023257_46030 [Streptomyces hyderabadensis]|uniref:Uncharacterized protein n=1 Tax=Streptomyces hyderabadensis TaxID=598549 RepID=A0ABP9IIA0_9ACTN
MAAVRLGRYLDVEITLVHGGDPVMSGRHVACAPLRVTRAAITTPNGGIRCLPGRPEPDRTDPALLGRGHDAAHVPQELPDPPRSAAEHQQTLVVHHDRRQERPAPHPQQHRTSYDIDGFAGTFRMAPHDDEQAPLSRDRGFLDVTSPEQTPREAPSHI